MNRNHLVKSAVLIVLFLTMIFVTEHAKAGNLKQELDVDSWIIDAEDSHWTTSELALVEEALLNTIKALDESGHDGESLLSGYRFRRQHNEFVDDVDGRIALVRHQKREIVLSDTAFLRLQGYYIYHELGHVVDRRMERQLSLQFHEIAGTAGVAGSQQTADGFWLNEHARTDRQEAAADAFALWVVMNYTDNYKPVFWNTPYTVNYELIVETLDSALSQTG